MSETLDVGHGIRIPVDEVTVRATRSSGPGGQHANVTASRIEASFDVAGSPSLSEGQKARIISRLGPRVTAVAQDARSLGELRALAGELPHLEIWACAAAVEVLGADPTTVEAHLAGTISMPRFLAATRDARLVFA